VIVTHDHRIGEIADTVLTIEDGRITGEIPGSEFKPKQSKV
jgi:ABC-type lipoprotein export system ATPase subunit